MEKAYNELFLYKNEKKIDQKNEKLERKYYKLAMKLNKALSEEEINGLLGLCDLFDFDAIFSVLNYLEKTHFEAKTKKLWNFYSNYFVNFFIFIILTQFLRNLVSEMQKFGKNSIFFSQKLH